MRMADLAVAATAVLIGAQPLWGRPQPAGPLVRIVRPDGRGIGWFVPHTDPITTLGESGPSVGWHLSRKDVRAKDGRIISAFRFTGWQQGAIVTVIVAARVPPDGAPNVYVEPELAMTQKRLLRSVEFTRLTLRVGQSRPIDEMRALGLEPLFVRAEPRTPVQKQPNRQLPNHQFQ